MTYVTDIGEALIREWLEMGLIEAVGRSADGRVTSYGLTHAGRLFATEPSSGVVLAEGETESQS